ncbi:MAG: arsenate reductase (azurin) small subunit [Thaumarchaeota archaeon]|nr:arsenate reductase (azurin) small subunit [Nitrososphaerota archaeon]
MTPEDDGKSERADVQSKGASPDDQSITRRNLLRAGLALGMVSVAVGVASVVRSLFSPANPPSPVEAQTTTPTVTKTVTATVTQAGGNQTAIASSSSASTSTATTSTSSSPFPQLMIANVSDLVESQPVSFNYPLEETPNILVKLGVKAAGGVGPDGDIVAYSVICQHLGCVVAYLPTGTGPGCAKSYKAPGPEAYCCCHGSIYDLVNGAAVIGGPAPRPVPQVTLSVDDSGNIFAVGMGPPTIFGHDTGSSNVLGDLQGGTPVSG